MGKHWRKYTNGRYSLGRLNGRAVAVWRDEEGVKHRYRLDAVTEAEGRSALDAFARKRAVLTLSSSRTIDDIYKLYRDDREQDGKQMEAFDANWKALKGTFGKLTADDITADLCRRYTRERCVKASQGTAWTELTRLRSCTNWAVKKRLITFKPDIWVPQKPEPKDRVLSIDEIGKLLDGCVMPHVKLFIILALATAGRTEALLELTWDRVDFERGVINLKLKVEQNPLTKKVRKGRSVVPMNEWARVALWEAKQGALTDNVIEWNAEPVKSIRKGFTAAVARAGLGSDVTPHTLRHTAASWLESDGIPMGQISRFLGHKTESVTRNIYAKPDTKALEEAANVLDFSKKKSRQT